MRHATSLDLVSFEDPSFYDILERARVQASDRVELLSAFGNLVQQIIALISMAAGVILFSPPVFLLLAGLAASRRSWPKPASRSSAIPLLTA